MGSSHATFVGEGAEGSSGVYLLDLTSGELRRLADSTSTLPGGNRPMGFPHAPAAAAGALVIIHVEAGPDATKSGLYAINTTAPSAPTPTWRAARPSSTDVLTPVATLESSHLAYLIARSDGFDGRCLALYGSDASADGLYTIAVGHDERAGARL